MKKNMFVSFTKGFAKIVFKTKKNSPVILLATGLAAGTGAVVLGYKAGPKVEKIVEKMETEKELGLEVDKKEVVIGVLKAVGPTVIAGTVAVGSIMWSHRIQTNRLTAVAGLLSLTQAANKKLENGIRRKFGEEVLNEIVNYDEVRTEEVDENGEVKETMEMKLSELDKTLGEFWKDSELYTNDHGYNIAQIQAIEKMLENKLFSRGFLYLNEVREALGYEKIRNGSMLGWTLSDYFEVNTRVINHERPDGEIEPWIRVVWATPKYIWDKVDYSTGVKTW